MLLSRRVPITWGQSVRLAVWPRHSWGRSLAYARLRLSRVRGRPRPLALGMAVGVFVAVLPIPGLQLAAAALLAWLVGGHGGAAALATFAANPITYPLFWVSSYLLGATILGTPVGNAARDLDAVADVMTHALTPSAWPSVAPLFTPLWPALATIFLGALPLASIAALATYAGVARLLRRSHLPADANKRITPYARRPAGRRRTAHSHTVVTGTIKAAA
jgi:uncharacterized protein